LTRAGEFLCAILDCAEHFDALRVQPYQKVPLPLTVADFALRSRGGNEIEFDLASGQPIGFAALRRKISEK
jgi:hypothetical protein